MNDTEKQSIPQILCQLLLGMSMSTVVLMTLFVSIPSTLWNGFVLSKLWEWFVVGLGFPIISAIKFAGMLLIYELIAFKTPKKEPDLDRCVKVFYYAIVVPAITLFIGFILHHL